MDNGIIIIHGEGLAKACIDHFILSLPPQASPKEQEATELIKSFVSPCINTENSMGLEDLFTKGELHFALSKLPNDKIPGLDGLTKEFILSF